MKNLVTILLLAMLTTGCITSTPTPNNQSSETNLPVTIIYGDMIIILPSGPEI